jgi:hypothetical protein
MREKVRIRACESYLLNISLQSLTHNVITIAEDVSGMPLLCMAGLKGGGVQLL